MNEPVHIRRLDAVQASAAVPALAELLIDCVEGGASVGFMLPIDQQRACHFWQTVADGVSRGERALLVAESSPGVVIGTAQGPDAVLRAIAGQGTMFEAAEIGA